MANITINQDSIIKKGSIDDMLIQIFRSRSNTLLKDKDITLTFCYITKLKKFDIVPTHEFSNKLKNFIKSNLSDYIILQDSKIYSY